MLMAYDDGGLKIKDIPADDTRVPRYPIEKLSTAIWILREARTRRPDMEWTISGKGPYRVVGTPKA